MPANNREKHENDVQNIQKLSKLTKRYPQSFPKWKDRLDIKSHGNKLVINSYINIK